jgi:hypothetical protein
MIEAGVLITVAWVVAWATATRAFGEGGRRGSG